MSDGPTDLAAADGCSLPQDGGRLGSSLQHLRRMMLAEGGLMRSLVVDLPPENIPGLEGEIGLRPPSGPAQIAASGPRVGAHSAEYELLIDMIYEGYLLHYHAPRIIQSADRDLRLLAGDRLYALGLANLVKMGDVEAVAELADVITLSALAHGGANPDLADAVWLAGARAVGWGASPQHAHAKALTRAASPDALEAMRRLLAV